ncbi:MAG: hypothetical protein FWD48_00395 [Oscillospiraceae bacterium]|nr:hypothetical protein [Oscillospiraceae bacterium]
MIIGSSFNVHKLTDTNIIKYSKPANNDKVAGFMSKNRFDFLEITDDSEFSARLQALKRKFLGELNGLTREERENIASTAYIEMQKILLREIKKEESSIEAFKQLSEERDTEGFEQRMESLLRGIPGFPGKLSSSKFNLFGEIFSAVTGINSSFLKIGSDSLCGRPDRTEENFISEANKNINNLKAQSDALYRMYRDFLGEEDDEAAESKQKLIKNGELLALLSEIKQLFTEAGYMIIDERSSHEYNVDKLYESLRERYGESE